jgi:phenylalanyl-tRNA synthetase alpha subunit
MTPEQWLEQAGSEYVKRIQAEEPQFLVEIDVSDNRLEEIFTNLSRAWQIRSTEQRLCLALAAVHSAARADEGEASFREVFYRRLRRPLNQAEWQNFYGPYIADSLKVWF